MSLGEAKAVTNWVVKKGSCDGSIFQLTVLRCSWLVLCVFTASFKGNNGFDYYYQGISIITKIG